MYTATPLNNLQNVIEQLCDGILNTTSAGAYSLFAAGVVAATVFYVYSFIRALIVGGGAALFETAGMRLFILLALAAVVEGWPSLAVAIRADILNFAAHIANVNPAAGTAGLTPDGIIQTFDGLIGRINTSGKGHDVIGNAVLMLWKIPATACLFLSAIGLALSLWFANVSLYIVFAGCAVLIGFVVSPWFQSFAMQYIAIIVGTAVFIIINAVMVSLAQTVALLQIAVIDRIPVGIGPFAPLTISGPAMMELALLQLLFTVLAWVIPMSISEKIAGGSPVVQIGGMLNAAKQGLSGLR